MTMSRWLGRRYFTLMLAALMLSASCTGGAREKSTADEHTQEKDGHAGEAQDQAQKDKHEGEHDEERIQLTEAALQTVTFKTVPLQRRALEREIRATAVVEPNEYRLAHVSPRISGRVMTVTGLLGDSVKQGQILAELDSLELGQTKAEYLTARTNLEVARANYEREKRLFKQKISSEKDYLDAQGAFLRADTQRKANREALRLVGLTDKEIGRLAWGGGKHPLSHFPLIAPFSGTVVEKHITIGELLSPEDKPYTIADLSTLWVLLDLYEKDLGQVRPGVEVRIAVEAYPDEVFEGKVTYISDLLDETTRTARARVEIPNPDRKLKPGMFATASLLVPVPSATAVLAIPADAIQRVRGKPVAFVQEGEHVFAARELTLGRNSGSYTEVLEGLSEGERVATEGGFYLKASLLKEEMGEGHAH